MTNEQVEKLAQALRLQFDAQVDSESVAPGRFRFAVTSRRFDNMPHLARQDMVWKVVDKELPREATMDVSLILAYAAADLAEMGQ